MQEPTLFDIDHSLTCRAEGQRASWKFAATQAECIHAYLKANGPQTAREIELGTGIRLTSVHRSLNELETDKRVKEAGVKLNRETGIHNTLWEAI